MKKMNWRNHYRKAITFSYDDGNEQDAMLTEILNQYGLKATFNVNTGLDYDHGTWKYHDVWVHRLNLQDSAAIYRGHEIAVHGSKHLNLSELSKDALHHELASDAEEIERLFGEAPVGMAYAYGVYNDAVINEATRIGLKYGRNVRSTHTFSEQENRMDFCPTCHHDDDQLFELAEHFLKMQTDEPQIFYIWGHSYEFEGKKNWDRFRRFCEKISGKSDIFYGTNRQVLL
ncbi:MAG: polysaccharide deacetylase family protein [Ruminococcus sp.]